MFVLGRGPDKTKCRIMTQHSKHAHNRVKFGEFDLYNRKQYRQVVPTVQLAALSAKGRSVAKFLSCFILRTSYISGTGTVGPNGGK